MQPDMRSSLFKMCDDLYFLLSAFNLQRQFNLHENLGAVTARKCKMFSFG